MDQATKSAAAILFEDESPDRHSLAEARRLVHSDPHEREALESAAEGSDDAFRLGAALWALGRFADAVEPLRKSKSHLAACLLGECLLRLGRYEEAVQAFAKAGGEEEFAGAMGAVEALRRSGKLADAEKRLAPWRTSPPDEAELLCQEGGLLAARGEYDAALDALRRATELAPEHEGALFSAAYWAELRGLDEEAVLYYERLAALCPAPVNALLNLGVLYEDRGEYEKAVETYQRALEADPTNECARLYLKDARSSLTERYDETVRRAAPRTNALLAMPVEDLELSQRSRGCLAAMNVHTLGDLVRLTEEDLMVAENFGDTSLDEIKEVLESKGLQLGAAAAPQRATADVLPQPSPEQMDAMERPIADLELSIRSRRALEGLKVATIRELVRLSEKELIKCKNFGQTSLNEINEKLQGMGLSLRPGDE